MRTVSQGFIDASVSPIGYASAYITIGSTTIDASNIIDITITEDIGGGAFTIGTFGTTEATMTVVSDALPNVIAGQPINIYFGYYVANAFEYVPMGVFYAEPRDITHKNLKTTIKAQDKSWSMTDTYTTSLDFTGTVYALDVLTEIQTALSLTMGSNGGLNPGYVRVYDAPQGSYRDVIAQMAMLMGTNAKLNRTGALDFIKANPSATPVQEYGAYDYSSDNYQLTSDEPMNISKLTVNYTHESNEEQVTDTYVYGSGSHGITLETTNVRTQAETNTLGQSVLGNGAVYYGYSATLPGQPHIDLGDVINITEPLGDDYNFIVLSATHGFNGAMKSTFTAVINDSDPQIAGDNIGNSLRDEVEKVSATVGSQGTRLSRVEDIAGNTDQYFWHTSTGQDTGAHITQIPQDTFVQNPSQGGSNLLARANGIAVRNGLTELAVFGATGSRVGLSGGASVTTQSDGIRIYDGAGNSAAFFGIDANNPSVRIGNTDLNGHIRIDPTYGVRFLRDETNSTVRMAQLASDGLQIWANDGTNNTSVAFYGAQCRVGPIADKNVYIGNGAINFRDNGTSLGEFTGTLARIGKADSSHIEIGATNGMNIFDQNNKIRLNASSTGISIFDYASSSSTTPINVAQFNTTARIGPADAQHINITTGGLDVYNSNNVSIASFGALTRIGAIADDTTRTEISSNGVKFIYRADSSNSYTLADIEYRNAYGDHTISKSPTYTFGVRGSGHYGKYSFVVGSSNIAAELFSTAFGLGTSATETGSFAEGWSTTASGKYSHAEGYMTTAGYDYQHVMGKCNGNDSNNAFEIGNGTVSAPTNIFQVGWNGDVYTAGALSVRGNFYVDSSGNVNLTLGSHYKINGTNLSASDVGAVPTTRTVNGKALSSNITLTNTDVGAVKNSYGSLTNVFPQGFTNADSIKVGITGSVKATPTATEDTQYLFGARAIAPVLYNDTTGTTIWTGYTTLNKPSASDVGALPIGGGTLTGDLTVNGKIQGLYRITSTTVATGSIAANSAKSATNYDITNYSTYIDAGYEPVAISGDATDNSAVSAFARIYDVSGTKKIRATFRNNSSSAVSTNYYFYILWLKATSA